MCDNYYGMIMSFVHHAQSYADKPRDELFCLKHHLTVSLANHQRRLLRKPANANPGIKVN